MYDENERNERHDQDVDYTEGAYSDSAYEEKNNDTAKKEETSDYGGYHDSRYRGSLDGEPEAAAGADPKENAEKQPERSYIPEERSGRGHGSKNTGKKIAALVMSGILFGCVAGGTMVGVNALSNRLLPGETAQETIGQVSQETQADAGTKTQASIGNDVSSIVEKAMPSVVAINNKMIYTQDNWLFGQQQYEVPSSGSGIIAGQNDTELLIITNNHVVEDSEELSVTFIDNQSVKAAVKGTDSDSDLAVIAVQLSDIPEETRKQIKAADLGDSDSLKLGQGVVAIGNALGQGQSVTVGYVSALNKKLTINDVERTLLQVDAAINPGNSGGALLNMKGEVIGINSAKLASTEVEGMGYAIPITRVSSIIEELMNETTRTKVADSQKSSIGIAGITVDSNINAAYGIPAGVYVASVTPGSGAEAAGIRKGDVITKFDGKTVSTIQELKEKLQYYAAGEAVSITVQSPGEGGIYTEKELTITLSSAQSSEESQSTDNTQAAPEKGNGTHKAMGYQN